MNISVNHRSSIPLHSQVEQILRELVKEPEYQDGKLFPKEVDLAKRLGVSRNTIRFAANRLVMEGLLVRKKGVGTKVVNKPVTTKLDSWFSFAHEMHEMGIHFKTWEVSSEWVVPDNEIANHLEITTDKKVLKMCRLRGIGQGPVVYFESFFHPRIGLTGNEDFSRPLYEILDKDYHTVAAISREEISVVTADKKVASKLQIKLKTPILLRRRIVLDPGERPVEYNVGFYNPVSFTYSIEIRRKGY